MNYLIARYTLLTLSYVMSVLYPFIVYQYMGEVPSYYFVLFIAVIILGRSVSMLGSKAQPHNLLNITLGFSAIVILIAITIIFQISEKAAILYYPVFMSLSFSTLLIVSLIFPPPLIERLARLKEPNLDKSGVEYTRKVTYLWLYFSLINACISFITCIIENPFIWTLYNGLISYMLIGLLFSAEYFVRCSNRNKSEALDSHAR